MHVSSQTVKNLPAMQETQVRFLGHEDSLGEGSGYPLQYSCLENSMDRGAWWAAAHGVAKSQTRLSDLTLSEDIRNYLKQQQQQQNTILMRHICGMNSLYKQVKSLSLDFMLFLWSNICLWKVCICVCICVPAVTAWSILRIKRHICYSQWWADLNRNHTWRTHVPTWTILWEISEVFGFFWTK